MKDPNPKKDGALVERGQKRLGDETLQIFKTDDPIGGTVKIDTGTKKVEHIGIKVELIGEIEIDYDKSTASEFTSTVLELAPPGLLVGKKEFDFQFPDQLKQYESYEGTHVRLRYYVRCTISKNGYASGNLVKEQEFWVQKVQEEPEISSNIKMEVGIEDCLHIEFEYDKSKYHLEDAIRGKVYFLLVRIKLKMMELSIVKQEKVGDQFFDSDVLVKFEVMDGKPVKDENIPIRLYLKSIPLTPTYKAINKTFDVKYLLNLVLIDEDDRRYFKQQEVVLWRKDINTN